MYTKINLSQKYIVWVIMYRLVNKKRFIQKLTLRSKVYRIVNLWESRHLGRLLDNDKTTWSLEIYISYPNSESKQSLRKPQTLVNTGQINSELKSKTYARFNLGVFWIETKRTTIRILKKILTIMTMSMVQSLERNNYLYPKV